MPPGDGYPGLSGPAGPGGPAGTGAEHGLYRCGIHQDLAGIQWQIYERGTGRHVKNGHQAGQHRQQCLHRRRCFAPGCHGRCHDCRQYLRR